MSSPGLWFDPASVSPPQQPAAAPPPPAAAQPDADQTTAQTPDAQVRFPQSVRDRAEVDGAALRRRMLTCAAVYGTARTWRDRRPIRAAVLVGLAVVGLVIGVIAIVHVFQTQLHAKTLPSPTSVVSPI